MLCTFNRFSRLLRTKTWRVTAVLLFLSIVSSALCAQDRYDEYPGGSMSNQKKPAAAIKLGPLDLTALFAPPIDPSLKDNRPLLKQETEKAFMQGQIATAMELFFGHLVIDYEAASADLQSVKFSPLLKRPIWQSRWAVSLAVRGDQVTDKNPIRDGKEGSRQQNSSMYDSSMYDSSDSMGSGMGSGMGIDGYGAQPTSASPSSPAPKEMLSSTANQTIDESLGLVAKVTADHFATRFSDGFFGAALASIVPKPIAETAEPNAGAATGARDRSGSSSSSSPDGRGPGGRGPGGYESEGRGPGGYESDGGGPGGYEQYPEEQMGSSDEGMSPGSQYGGGAEVAAVAEPESPGLDLGTEPFPMWQPGLVFLGEMSSADAIAKAQSNKIDFLLHFDVVLKEIRSSRQPDAKTYTQNISRCRLIGVSDGKTITTTKPTDSIEAARQKGTNLEYVEAQMANLFMVIDRQLLLSEMPTLTPEVVKRRVTALMAGREAKNLATMAEIRYYQLQGLLSAEDAEKAFFILGDDDGLKMLHATEEEKIKVIYKWVSEALTPR